MSATLLLGGCELLWGAFGETNPAFCDPAAPGCTNPLNADGGIDLAGADAAMSTEDTDAGTGTGDASAAQDAAVVDSAQGPDLLCQPSAFPWTTNTDVLSLSTTVTLTGVAGNGAGDLWVVGNPNFVAHYKTSWNQITVPALTITSFGRAAYAPKQSQVLAIGSTLLASGVAHLTTTTMSGSVDGFGLLSGVPGGIWISAAPESQPYLVSLGLGATLKAYNGNSWTDVVSAAPTPFALNGIAGSGTGAATTIWGVSDANNPVVSFTTATKWKTATSTTGSFNAVWVSPISGVVVVGNNGAIMNTPATPTVNPLMAMGSPVSTTLNDVAGSVDGSHLWAVGNGGTIVHWDSGCKKWLRETNANSKDLNALWVDDAQKTVWAVGANGAVVSRKFP